MGAIKEYLIKKFLLGYLKDTLDKIPGNGFKTALGILLFVLDLLKPLYVVSPYGNYIALVIDVINQLSPVPVKDIAISVVITGAVHKILKYFGKDVPETPVVVQ
jgi:endonuclease III-like uncharacterized protein